MTDFSSSQNTTPNNTPELRQRNLAVRILMGCLWFIPLYLLISMVIGGIVGGMAGVDNIDKLTDGSISDSYNAGAEIGARASKEFVNNHIGKVLLGSMAFTFVLSFLGKLPGTTRYKKIK